VFPLGRRGNHRADKAKEDWMPTWLLVLLIVLLVLAVFGGFGYTRR
jgi:hypothetical protein